MRLLLLPLALVVLVGCSSYGSGYKGGTLGHAYGSPELYRWIASAPR